MGDERSSGSNAGVVIVIVLSVLALFCCGGVALLGAGVFAFRVAGPVHDVQMVGPPPMDAKMEPMLPPELPPLEPLPAESFGEREKSDPSPLEVTPPSDSFEKGN
jgi:hypothetical protein